MAEGQGVTQAYWNADTDLEGLLARLNCPSYQLYLTGDSNFRYDIFPEYKANRASTPRPEYLKDVKQYLVENYNAVISDGCEADDLCGIDQCQSNAAGEDTILVHIDKDLDMIPGVHFSPEIIRLSKVVRPERQYIVSPNDALKVFYTQLLTGDPGDGVKGASGIGKVKAEKILRELTTEQEMYTACLDYFSCEEELEMNAQVLWIWREPMGIWRKPSFETSIE